MTADCLFARVERNEQHNRLLGNGRSLKTIRVITPQRALAAAHQLRKVV